LKNTGSTGHFLKTQELTGQDKNTGNTGHARSSATNNVKVLKYKILTVCNKTFSRIQQNNTYVILYTVYINNTDFINADTTK